MEEVKSDKSNSKMKEKINSNISEKFFINSDEKEECEKNERFNQNNSSSKIDKNIKEINTINSFPSFNTNTTINSFNINNNYNFFETKNNSNFNKNINIINSDNIPFIFNINDINNINDQNSFFSNNQSSNININNITNNLNKNINKINNNINDVININKINNVMNLSSQSNNIPNNITNINNINNINIGNFIQNINTYLNKNLLYQNCSKNGINNTHNNFIFDEIDQILQKSKIYNQEYINKNNGSNHKCQNLNNLSSLNLNKKKNGIKKRNNLFKNNYNLSKGSIKEKDIRDFKRFCDGLKCSLPDYICSQIGSRIMQKYLNKFPPFIITNLIEKIYMDFEKMMCNIYGNYFCQKLYIISSIEQRRMILNGIKDIFVSISKTTAGAHVAQSIIEESSTKEEKAIIMSYVKGNELGLALHPEGTHVLQKIIQIFPENERQNLTDVLCINTNVNILCQDLKGISVIKRLISFNTEEINKIKLVESFFGNCLEISKTSSGSYIIQYLLEQWGIDIALKLILFCITNFELFATNKHSANLLDKIIIICLKRYSIIRYFDNNQSNNFINNEIFIINTLKNIILEQNKIVNIYKNKYGKALILKIRKLLSIEENEKLYLFIKSLETVPNYLESKKYKIYVEIYDSH